MTVEQMTARINELYHKSQAQGLSEAEKEEQHRLRQAYVANVRANLRGQLAQISIVEQDGSITNLGDKKVQKAQEAKKAVRTKTLALRDALSKQDREGYSREIRERLTALPCYQEADALLTYASYRSEVETFGLIEQALLDHKLVFAPKVEGRDMTFYQITDLCCLREGYRGIPEPAAGRSFEDYLVQTRGGDDAASGQNLDSSGQASGHRVPQILVCMPGAAFDKARRRIGYGGGFYDRFLKKLSLYQEQGQCHITTAALAYRCQVLEEIPRESHDVTPDILLTEEGCM